MPDPNADFSHALAASFAALGLRDVCISPGSRNTPLTLAFADHPELRSWSHHDERSAGFFALGLARASGRPVAVVCTSGTAAVEYHPAVVEALQSGVPLLVLTADRPPELRDVGAPQAIDQVKLYGDHVKWSHTAAPPDAAAISAAPALAAHAWGECIESPAGPVHLNLPYREPLVPELGWSPGPSPVAASAVIAGNRVPGDPAIAKLDRILAGRKALFVVGSVPRGSADVLDALAAALDAVVFADPQSGLRSGERVSAVVAAADLLTATGALDADPPDVVVRWGALPTSKPVWHWLEMHPRTLQVLVDPGAQRDPLRSASLVVRADVAPTAARIHTPGGPPEWADGWRARDAAAQAAIETALAAEAFPTEPAVARTVAAAAPADGFLFAGSSMPIRDLDAFAAPRPARSTVLANRGTNGIDGSISTALGIAATGRPTVALIGDVAALYDLGALATMRRLDLPLTLVIVHNDGGGIFELLSQADPERIDRELFERHIATPHGTDFVAVAQALGVVAHRTADADELARLVSGGAGPVVVEVRTERSELAAVHTRLREAVAVSPAG